MLPRAALVEQECFPNWLWNPGTLEPREVWVSLPLEGMLITLSQGSSQQPQPLSQFSRSLLIGLCHWNTALLLSFPSQAWVGDHVPLNSSISFYHWDSTHFLLLFQ